MGGGEELEGKKRSAGGGYLVLAKRCGPVLAELTECCCLEGRSDIEGIGRTSNNAHALGGFAEDAPDLVRVKGTCLLEYHLQRSPRLLQQGSASMPLLWRRTQKAGRELLCSG